MYYVYIRIIKCYTGVLALFTAGIETSRVWRLVELTQRVSEQKPVT